MNRPWIVRVARDRAVDLARLRGIVGLEVAQGDDAIWLRSPPGDEVLDRRFRTIAGERFHLTRTEELVPHGKLVPTQRLPELAWQPLVDWASIALPVAGLAAESSTRLRLRLVRGGAERTPGALLTNLDSWLSYATRSPEVRLRPLTFAVAEDERVLIAGTPLPPIAGRPYVLADGIAAACGYSLSPAVGQAVIRTVLKLADGDVALFNVDGTLERIAADQFVAATRGAARATVEEMAHG